MARSPERKPKLRRKRAASEAGPAGTPKRKRSKRESALDESPEPVFIDILPDPAEIIELLDSDDDDDDDWPIAL